MGPYIDLLDYGLCVRVCVYLFTWLWTDQFGVQGITRHLSHRLPTNTYKVSSDHHTDTFLKRYGFDSAALGHTIKTITRVVVC